MTPECSAGHGGERQNEAIQRLHWLAETPALGPLPRRCHRPRLMPLAADMEQEEGLSPRPSPSIRQETWGIEANYLKVLYRRGWVGRKTKIAMMAGYRKETTEMKRIEEQEWTVARY